MSEFQRLSDALPRARESGPQRTSPEPKPTPEEKQTKSEEWARGIPSSRVGNSFENFDVTLNPGMAVALEAAKKVAKGLWPRALLVGDCGSGKTHLAIAALNLWREKYDNGLFWKVPEFLDWLRRTVWEEEGDLNYAIHGYRSGQCLIVFDDFGAHNPTEWATEQLYRVFDARYDHDLPTIITSNAAVGSLDKRIVSRYRDGLVICSGKDVRGRQP